jgi:hypothetical protein
MSECLQCGGEGLYVNSKGQTEVCRVCDGGGEVEIPK